MSAVFQYSPPNIRPMTVTDVAAVMEIEQSVYPYPWTEGIFRDCIQVGYSCWVALHEEQIVGYAVVSIAVAECHILNVAVHPGMQGQGLGRYFMEHLLSVAKRRGADIAFLEVRPSNEVALGLYHSMGFNQFGTRKRYYPAENGREDAVVMALNL